MSTRSRVALQAAVLAMTSFIACVSERSSESELPGILTPSDLSFPYIAMPSCPGETCSYGPRLACDSVLVFKRPGDSLPSGFLSPGDTFEVASGATVVQVPEVVVVTRPVTPSPYEDDPISLLPGDTVYVLDYLSEGIFNFWYDGRIRTRFSFWPSTYIDFGPDFDYRGKVVQEAVSSYWVQAPTSASENAWTPLDGSSVPLGRGDDGVQSCDAVDS
jgi:hypothetical protein